MLPPTDGLAIALARIADEKKNRTGFVDGPNLDDTSIQSFAY